MATLMYQLPVPYFLDATPNIDVWCDAVAYHTSPYTSPQATHGLHVMLIHVTSLKITHICALRQHADSACKRD